MTNLSTIDLNLLRALDALLATRSVSQGARQLGITQAAASNALGRLRAHFGDELLVRQGQKMVPTPLADDLAPRAAAAMALAARVLLPEAARFDPAKAHGTVRIATSDHVDALVVEPLAAALSVEAPGISVYVEAFSSSAVERAIGGEVAMVMAPRRRFSQDLRAAHLFSEGYVVVMRLGHPYAGARLDSVTFSRLRHVVVSPSGGPEPTPVDAALEALGLARSPERAVPVFSQALLLVTESDLVATVPASFAARYSARLGLAIARPPVEIPPIQIACGWSPRNHNDPLHTWVRRRAVQIATSEAASAAAAVERADVQAHLTAR